MFRYFRRWSMIFIAGVLISLASAGVVACGYNGSLQNGTSATQQSGVPITQQKSRTAAQHQTQVPHTPQQIQTQPQQCGVVFAYGALLVVPQDDSSKQVEDCFWQAFQHCRPATLVFTADSIVKRSTAGALTRTFAISTANGACTISDRVQKGTFPHELQPLATYMCTGLRQQPQDLEVLSCGQDGTVSVLGA